MAEELEHATFLENLNSKFRLQLEDSEVLELELIEVSELKAARRQEMFSIVFRSSSPAVLPQRIFRLQHHGMGEFDLFLVPVGKDEHGVHYEAVFNRFRPLGVEA
jgi:hypothetical protein